MQQQLGGVIGQITRLYDTGKAAASQLGMQVRVGMGFGDRMRGALSEIADR